MNDKFMINIEILEQEWVAYLKMFGDFSVGDMVEFDEYRCHLKGFCYNKDKFKVLTLSGDYVEIDSNVFIYKKILKLCE